MPSLFKTLLLLANVILVALAVRPLGIGKDEMKFWGLTVVFVGVMLTMLEDAAWSLFITKESGEQRRRTIRVTALGVIVCLIVAIAGGFYGYSEQQHDVDYQRKMAADHARMREYDKTAAEAAPILQRLRDKREAGRPTTMPAE